MNAKYVGRITYDLHGWAKPWSEPVCGKHQMLSKKQKNSSFMCGPNLHRAWLSGMRKPSPGSHSSRTKYLMRNSSSGKDPRRLRTMVFSKRITSISCSNGKFILCRLQTEQCVEKIALCAF